MVRDIMTDLESSGFTPELEMGPHAVMGRVDFGEAASTLCHM